MTDLTGQAVSPWPLCRLEPYDCEASRPSYKAYRCAVCKVFVSMRSDEPLCVLCGIPALGQRWKVADGEGVCVMWNGLVSGSGFVGGDMTFTLRMDDGSTKDFKWGEGTMV